jgi:hypothetical protein
MYAMVRTGSVDDKFAADIEKVHDAPWFKLSGLPYLPVSGVSEGEKRFLLFEPIPILGKSKSAGARLLG